MLPLGTKIPTPSGWTTIGDIAVGDELFDEQGQICHVTAVHPVDLEPVSYKLTFDDNTTIVACADHSWLTLDAVELGQLTRWDPVWREARKHRRASRSVIDLATTPQYRIDRSRRASISNAQREYDHKPPPTGTVRTTQQIADTLLTPSGRRNHAIPVAQPLQLPHSDLPVDPYVLGAWLGDGNSRHASITCHDPEILGRIAAAGYRISGRDEIGAFGICSEDGTRARSLQVALRALDLFENKHIPQIYLRASVAQRTALLQGLMDTDGNCTERGACEFTTTKPKLRDGMAELLVSLGIKAGGSEGRATLNGRDIGPKYRFKFVTPIKAFHLARKAERQSFGERRMLRYRYITACDRVDPVPMRCITVDSESHLYLAGAQMVPTHNTDLILGMAITLHWRSIIFRREYQQLKGVRDRAVELLTGKGRYNGALELWRLNDGKVIEFGALQKEDDKLKYQGRPHDLLCVDEITHITESQFRFIIGWNRSTKPGQRSRVVVTGNPPTDAQGDWVISFWAPWLDPLHPNPAQDGELRWFASIDGKDVERPNGEPFDLPNERTGIVEKVQPVSRTFIRAWINDNPHLAKTGYLATLQALPEPLRSKMLLGDFSYGRADDSAQVIPTAWVLAAQQRWEPDRPGWVDAIGVDVGRGGGDKTVLAMRSGAWMDHLVVRPGSGTPNAQSIIQLIAQTIPVGHRPDVQIDVIGVGAAVFDLAVMSDYAAYAMNSANSSFAKDRSGQLKFSNKRAEWWWRLRELLDPDSPDDPIALPPDRELLADLTAPHWEITLRGVKVESKDDIRTRIGRSTDKGDAAIYAFAVPALPPMVRLI
jgi:hypothetical protein